MAAAHVVQDGVVDEVRHKPLHEAGVSGRGGRAQVYVHAQVPARGFLLARGHDRAGHLREVNGFSLAQSALAAGQREQRLGSTARGSTARGSTAHSQRVTLDDLVIAAMREATLSDDAGSEEPR